MRRLDLTHIFIKIITLYKDISMLNDVKYGMIPFVMECDKILFHIHFFSFTYRTGKRVSPKLINHPEFLGLMYVSLI